MASFNYVRLYTGDDGLSHFEDIEVPLAPWSDASLLSETLSVTGMNFRSNVKNYDLDYHPAPRRQFIVNLSGAVEITASDGEVRVFGPGSVMLAEDTTGKGHRSKAVSDDERRSLFIYWPE
jgi:hypothetical protein